MRVSPNTVHLSGIRLWAERGRLARMTLLQTMIFDCGIYRVQVKVTFGGDYVHVAGETPALRLCGNFLLSEQYCR